MRTLGSRFLLIVLMGVVVPLAVVGVWLTRSAERSGRELLHQQLEQELTRLARSVEDRARARAGEMQLLANNASALALLSGVQLSAADSGYLGDLVRSLGPAITGVQYRNGVEQLRWHTELGDRTPSDSMLRPVDGQRISIALPVRSAAGVDATAMPARIGTVQAEVLLSRIIPLDSTTLLAAGAVLALHDSLGTVIWSSRPGAVDLFDSVGSEWERITRPVSLAAMQLELLAPVAPFVEPFERSTRNGLLVLSSVLLASMLLSVVLTRQLTASLRELSAAASGVASGTLDRTVRVRGDDEVGQLAEAFNAMTSSLRDTVAELSRQRSLAAVGEFATLLSHEVRNSLTSVRADLQHAARHVDESHPGAPLLARSLDSVRRLDGTVTSALRLARSGQVARVAVPLADVLHDAQLIVQPVFDEREVMLAIPEALDITLHQADHAALSQLFVNLLLNSAQAMPSGGVAAVSIERDEQHVHISVHDDGNGLPAGTAMFEPWRTTKRTGTGLGLSMAHRIAEAHGGTLTLTNGERGGTRVVVSLPLYRQGPAHSLRDAS
ncbi:MAG TPA: HAMP domain-containing sensor histidine kinase [Gemmatimonas sp.]|nr:HAMP domain-containing sensor histidine kinase [Gemmatimonas sp.]